MSQVNASARESASALVRRVWLAGFLVLTGIFLGSIYPVYQEFYAAPFFVMSDDPAAVAAALSEAGISRSAFAAYRTAIHVFWNLPPVILGLLVFLRRSGDKAALLISFLLLFSGYGSYGPPIIQALGPAAQSTDLVLVLLSPLALVAVFYLFPNGRFVPRWAAWGLVYMLLIQLPPYIWPGFSLAGSAQANPDSSLLLTLLITIPVFASMVYSQVYRYRRVSGPVERLQTRWIVVGLVALPFTWLLNALVTTQLFRLGLAPGDALRTRLAIDILVFQPLYLVLPFTLTVSLLRYRLWDIDVIIRRTLLYSSLTAVLLLVYFGTVTVLQSVFVTISEQSSPLSIVLSTLAIAALANPLRSRIQGWIDRRFFRAKYNAEQALAVFAAASAHGRDLEDLSGQMLGVVKDTLQPEQLSLWLVPQK